MEKQSVLKNILFLDNMYAPKIINVLYILLVVASIAGGIFLCLYEMPDIAISYDFDVSVNMKRYVKEGIALIILGPIFARLFAELLIILFKINMQTSRLADMFEKENQHNNK